MTNDKTIEQLRKKALSNYGDGVKMPSIKDIHSLLLHYRVNHRFEQTQNVVEYRSKGKRYVNSRHMGKRGWKIEVDGNGEYFGMNTSDSYYSTNAWSYARRILELIGTRPD